MNASVSLVMNVWPEAVDADMYKEKVSHVLVLAELQLLALDTIAIG